MGEVNKPIILYYIGDWARNGQTRGLDHQEEAKKQQTNNALGKHGQVDWDVWITSTHRDPLTWQVQEGVNIVTEPPEHSGMEVLQMNSKLEYLQGVVPQTRTQRGTVF